jgi:hypothetical protein
MEEILQFQNYSSAPDASFWQTLSEYKLNVAKLEEKETTIWGYYFPAKESSTLDTLQVDSSRAVSGSRESRSKLSSRRAYMYISETSLDSQTTTP